MSMFQRSALHVQLLDRLAEIPALAGAHRCALLTYPAHGNLGDHLIWIAQIHVLEQILGIKICYATAPDRYCLRSLKRVIGDQPIVLSGGGQLGDQWPRLQAFIERVVNGHHHNAVIIFPQSISFRDPACLRRAAASFQAHPDLTLLLRDRMSFQFAQRHFSGCRLMLTPDLAFSLPVASLFPNPLSERPQRPWLALRRRDRERGVADWQQWLAPWRGRVECSDWLPLERGWFWGDPRIPLSRSAAAAVRELLQSRLLMPREALARQRWERQLPVEWQRALRLSRLTSHSLAMVHLACRQIVGRRLVITDRLHAMILSSLLGIPSLALDNRTGKIHNFLATWGAWIPEAQPIVTPELPQRLLEIAHCSLDAPVSSTI